MVTWVLWLCLDVQEVWSHSGPIPVLYHLQYLITSSMQNNNMEGEGSGDFIACDDIRYIDRG